MRPSERPRPRPGVRPTRPYDSGIRTGPAQQNRPSDSTVGTESAPLPSSGYRGGPVRGERYHPPNGGGDGDSGSGGHNHGGGHHGGGHNHGGHYGGYYGGYFGFGYPYYGYGYGSYFPFYYGHNYYSPYAGLSYGRSPYYRSRYVRSGERIESQGALDLNIKPKDAEVYLNGYFIGTVGDFDGWPRYLWIDQDVHELIFYKEGYETIVREISVQAEAVVNVKLRMQRGNATPPDELTRYVDDREYRSQTAPQPSDRSDLRYGGPSRDDRAYEDDRARDDRARDDRARDDRAGNGPGIRGQDITPPAADRQPSPDEIDLRSDNGRLVLTVTPPEASVYIDGRFVGIGGELTAIGIGLLMDPGEHEIQIFHPGHETQEKTFEVTAGDETKLEIDLTED